LIQIIKTASFATKAMRSAADGRLGDAHVWLDRLDRVRPLLWSEKGFRALLWLMEEDFDRSEAEFRAIVEGTARSPSRDDIYVHLFAKARIAALHGSDDLMHQYELEAARVKASGWAKGWLPLERR
jgi:hypothetical protein